MQAEEGVWMGRQGVRRVTTCTVAEDLDVRYKVMSLLST